MTASQSVHLRGAVRSDLPTILMLIEALAEYERLSHECHASIPLLDAALFGPRPYAEVIIADVDGVPAGFALYFHNFSTVLAKPGIYLEDLFVRSEYRGIGIGQALLERLAQIAIERGCGRLEWSVLDWNVDAIRFYKRLGAVPQDEWTVFRVSGDDLAKLSAGTVRIDANTRADETRQDTNSTRITGEQE